MVLTTRRFVDGEGNVAKFSDPCGLSADADGTLFVADTGNNCIRKVSPGGVVTTFTGSRTPGYKDGPPTLAQFAELCDVQVGGFLLFACG